MAPCTPEKRFNPRRFVVLATTFSGLGLPVTGFGIDMAHGGPITPLLKTFHVAHAFLAILFILCCVWHMAINWGALKRALSGRECALAIGLTATLWLLAAAH